MSGRAFRKTAALALLGLLVLGCLLGAPAGGLADLPLGPPFATPGATHPFGTDDLGRDLLAAMAQAGRTSLKVAGLATLVALGLGAAAGLAAGTAGRLADEGLMRLADMVAGLPTLLVALTCLSLFGGSWLAVALVIGFTRWPLVARLVRVEAQVLGRSEFVRAAKALGLSRTAVVRRHILPGVAVQLAAAAGILFGGALIAESAIAFVGLGDPSATSWGQLLAAGFTFADRAWWVWALPAAGLVAASALVAVAAE